MSSNTVGEVVVLQKLPDCDTTEITAVKRLSVLNRFLSLWILVAMVGGTLIGVYIPTFRNILNTSKFDQVSLPVLLGLLLMLYPVFCKVRYEELNILLSHRNSTKYLAFSFVLNWLICPLVMAALAWACLPDLPEYRTGILLIGVARCIAMVLIWNDLAGGDAEWCAILVSLNSVLQMLLFAPLAYFYTVVLGGSSIGSMQMWPVVQNVLIFLGIPFVGGLATRVILRRLMGANFYDGWFVKFISPFALVGLLYTIFIMFAVQGNLLVHQIGPVFRVTVPLFLYFGLVWFMTMYLSKLLKFPFPIAITQSFTAASNNFELALAIAIATFGVDSHEALATTIGPLIEVPVLLSLVYVTPIIEKFYH
jgi:ACR3 family arsenite transporter